MRKGLFFRLAVSNIRRNRGTYIPYMLTCIFCISMMYMLFFITQNPNLVNTVPCFLIVKTILLMGIIVIGIFSFIFLLYSNSFLVKRRQKELGLYNILGMEKGHIKKMMIAETLMTSVISMIAGILVGILGSKLSLLLLLKILHVPAQLGFYVCGSGIAACIVFFGIVFMVTLAANVCKVSVSQPAELLRGGSMGEREPRAKWLLALIGFICLGSGYYIAVTTESPLQAISLFFLAVVLVMAGTYLLFTTGSIAILKMLRWKKSFYYKTKNFTTVSGMIYRMKQNAMGLASICILSTGVLLMLSASCSLNLGMEDIMKNRYPHDANYHYYDVTLEEGEQARAYFEKILEQEKVPCEETMEILYLSFACLDENGDIRIKSPKNDIAYEDLGYLVLITQEEYERLTGKNAGLQTGEILAYSEKKTEGDLAVNGETYHVKEWLKNNPIMEEESDFKETIMVVTREDLEKIDQIQKEIYGERAGAVQLSLGMNIAGSREEKLQYGNQIAQALNQYLQSGNLSEKAYFMEEIREENYADFYSSNGGLLFLGIFLGSLFLVGAGMIIYYKQMSEGYEDKERFEIMQKVGMSRREVKESIRRQILMVFFIPLLMAVLHITMAFPMVRRLLGLFGLMNTNLYMLCTAGTIGVFTVIYAIIYLCTAKAYYRIVERKA